MMKLSVQHQGRELLHAIDLLARCLQLPGCSAGMRADWNRDILRARTDLEGLYVGGLDRDFSRMSRLGATEVQPPRYVPVKSASRSATLENPPESTPPIQVRKGVQSDDRGKGADLFMRPGKALKPFGQATLEELVEESRRLRGQAEELRQKMAELGKVIDERTTDGEGPAKQENRDTPPAAK